MAIKRDRSYTNSFEEPPYKRARYDSGYIVEAKADDPDDLEDLPEFVDEEYEEDMFYLAENALVDGLSRVDVAGNTALKITKMVALMEQATDELSPDIQRATAEADDLAQRIYELVRNAESIMSRADTDLQSYTTALVSLNMTEEYLTDILNIESGVMYELQELHRELTENGRYFSMDLPDPNVVVLSNGTTKYFMSENRLHRADGPAVIFPGSLNPEEWWWRGQRVERDDHPFARAVSGVIHRVGGNVGIGRGVSEFIYGY